MSRLEGKVALITGATGGIGRAASKLFADEGARVVLVDLDESALQDAVQSIGADRASYHAADVTQPDQAQSYVQAAVERWGGIDIYLANAGIEGSISPIPDYPIDVFDRVMAVNVRGVWLGIKYVVPAMRERGGGSIVITSSTAGIGGSTDMSAYTTSKHAVIGLMRTAALEGAPPGNQGQYRQSRAHRDADDAFHRGDARCRAGRCDGYCRTDEAGCRGTYSAATLRQPRGSGQADALPRQ